MIPFANPYMIMAAAGAALALSGSSFYAGHHWATTKAEAAQVEQAAAYTKKLHEAIAYGSEVAAKLAAAEGRIVVKTVEVIKHVPSVTTGTTPCLSAAAVSLLNPGATWGPSYPATGRPVDQGSGSPSTADRDASDRDIAYWIATANQQYETAAARLNALIDWHQTQAATVNGD